MATNFLRSIGRAFAGIVESISPTKSSFVAEDVGGLRNLKRSLGIESLDELDQDSKETETPFESLENEVRSDFSIPEHSKHEGSKRAGRKTRQEYWERVTSNECVTAD